MSQQKPSAAGHTPSGVIKPPSHGIGRRRALLIGLDRYDDPKLGRLDYCVSDVQTLASRLKEQGFVEVKLMHDGLEGYSAPTEDNLNLALLRFAATSRADDLLLVHFSGHGKMVGGLPYLYAKDTPADLESVQKAMKAGTLPPSKDPKMGLPVGQLVSLLTKSTNDTLQALKGMYEAPKGLPADMLADFASQTKSQLDEIGFPPDLSTVAQSAPPRWLAVFLDACYIGVGGPFDSEISDTAQQLAGGGGGFAMFSGSTESQITLDSDQRKSGVFTAAVLDGLSGAAAAPDGSVSLTGLAAQVQKSVALWLASPEGRSKGALQMPVVRLEGADFALFPPKK